MHFDALLNTESKNGFHRHLKLYKYRCISHHYCLCSLFLRYSVTLWCRNRLRNIPATDPGAVTTFFHTGELNARCSWHLTVPKHQWHVTSTYELKYGQTLFFFQNLMMYIVLTRQSFNTLPVILHLLKECLNVNNIHPSLIHCITVSLLFWQFCICTQIYGLFIQHFGSHQTTYGQKSEGKRVQVLLQSLVYIHIFWDNSI